MLHQHNRLRGRPIILTNLTNHAHFDSNTDLNHDQLNSNTRSNPPLTLTVNSIFYNLKSQENHEQMKAFEKHKREIKELKKLKTYESKYSSPMNFDQKEGNRAPAMSRFGATERFRMVGRKQITKFRRVHEFTEMIEKRNSRIFQGTSESTVKRGKGFFGLPLRKNHELWYLWDTIFFVLFFYQGVVFNVQNAWPEGPRGKFERSGILWVAGFIEIAFNCIRVKRNNVRKLSKLTVKGTVMAYFKGTMILDVVPMIPFEYLDENLMTFSGLLLLFRLHSFFRTFHTMGNLIKRVCFVM